MSWFPITIVKAFFEVVFIENARSIGDYNTKFMNKAASLVTVLFVLIFSALITLFFSIEVTYPTNLILNTAIGAIFVSSVFLIFISIRAYKQAKLVESTTTNDASTNESNKNTLVKLNEVQTTQVELQNSISHLKHIMTSNLTDSYNIVKSMTLKDQLAFMKILKDNDCKTGHLDEITTLFRSNHGHRFICVISFKNYFSTTQSPGFMLKYFAKFDNTNYNHHIHRVFTVPGRTREGETETKYTNSENRSLLKSLIVNKVCSIETTLLIYHQDNSGTTASNKAHEFFVNADYVLYSGKNGRASSNSDLPLADHSILYFAYPDSAANQNQDKIIRTSDRFLITIFEMEFEKRMQESDTTRSGTVMYKFNRSNQDKIFKILGLNLNDPNALGNLKAEIIEDLKTKNNDYLEVIKKVNTWFSDTDKISASQST